MLNIRLHIIIMLFYVLAHTSVISHLSLFAVKCQRGVTSPNSPQ